MAVIARALLQGFIKKGVSQGLSGNAILKSFRAQGLQIRTQTFFDDYRSIQGIAKKSGVLKFVPKNKRIGRQLFTELTGFSPNRFRYVGEIRATNNATGEKFTFNASTAGKDQLSVGNAEDHIINSLERGKYGDDYTIDNIVLVEAYHREGDTW